MPTLSVIFTRFVNPPEVVNPPEPPTRHVPFTAKHPASMLMPWAKVDVAVDDALIWPNDPIVNSAVSVEVASIKSGLVWPLVPVTESFAYGEVVPMPMLPELSIVKDATLPLFTRKVNELVTLLYIISPADGAPVSPKATNASPLVPPMMWISASSPDWTLCWNTARALVILIGVPESPTTWNGTPGCALFTR